MSRTSRVGCYAVGTDHYGRIPVGRRSKNFDRCRHTSVSSLRIFQTTFVVDEVSSVIKEVCHVITVLLDLLRYVLSVQGVETVIGGSSYHHNKVNQWTSSVVEQCLNQLTKLNKPFKYIGLSIDVVALGVHPASGTLCVLPVSCVIMQKNGAGLHTAASCFWDNSTDGKKMMCCSIDTGALRRLDV